VTRRAFGLGEQIGGAAHYFTTDHLGSVREVTDSSVALLVRYAFDPWGRRTVVSGTDVTTVGFTGHRQHGPSGLALTLYRGYDAGLGRWVSEDPIGVFGGAHLLAYATNSPIGLIDPDGLLPAKWDPNRMRRVACLPRDWAFCNMICLGRKVLNCSVMTHSKSVRSKDGLDVWRTTRRPPDCECEDPPECELCRKLPVWVVAIGGLVWMCVTRTPAPI
jgi:RHS repeat-associated protein